MHEITNFKQLEREKKNNRARIKYAKKTMSRMTEIVGNYVVPHFTSSLMLLTS